MNSNLEIIERCKQGNKKAQKQLYQLYAASMLGVCMRYASCKAEAEDILQEGFLKVFLSISGYEERGMFEAWLKKIFINTAITFYHKNRKHRFNLDIDEMQDVFVTNNDRETNDFTQEELLKIINSLPDGYRMVFNLYAMEGMKHKEIADLLKIDENTSKSQYSRARKIIQKKLIGLDKDIKHRIND
jgi:RNA polymerase sigma-70 factor (ECF subfamily)